jgi:ATP-binding cassette subfamily B protein
MALLIIANTAFAVCGVVFALLSRGVIDGAAAGDKHSLIYFSLLLLGIILSQLFLRMLGRNIEEVIKARLEIGYRTKLFTQILHKDYAAITAYHSGELLNHLTSDVTIISEGVTTILPSLVSMLTRLICAFAVLIALDGRFALAFVIGGSLLFIIVGAFRGIMKRMHKKAQETDGKLRSFMQESIESLLVIKIFGAEGQIADQSSILQQDNYRAKMKRITGSIFANAGFNFVFQIGYLYALVWGAYKIYLHAISFGTLTAVIQLVGQVQTPFLGLSGLLPRYYGALASAERIMELEKLAEDAELNSSELDFAGFEQKFSAIVFADIAFKYDRDNILEDFNFTINKGDFVLLAGSSGIGKSTLIKLLLGVFTPDQGEIYLQIHDGTRIQAGRYSRKLFAYVPQGNFLLSGTIRENIAFVNPRASDNEILEAARVSCAEEFIQQLPEGFNTIIGEKGFGLSEGQVQRIAIARAILSDAPIILLDEASSALDELTEQRLLKNLRSMINKTCLMISHRPAARNICNKVVTLAREA